jgi:hypothetical protein
MNANKIPDIIIGRLQIYLRALERMADKAFLQPSQDWANGWASLPPRSARIFPSLASSRTGTAIASLSDRQNKKSESTALGRRRGDASDRARLARYQLCQPRVPVVMVFVVTFQGGEKIGSSVQDTPK